MLKANKRVKPQDYNVKMHIKEVILLIFVVDHAVTMLVYHMYKCTAGHCCNNSFLWTIIILSVVILVVVLGATL